MSTFCQFTILRFMPNLRASGTKADLGSIMHWGRCALSALQRLSRPPLIVQVFDPSYEPPLCPQFTRACSCSRRGQFPSILVHARSHNRLSLSRDLPGTYFNIPPRPSITFTYARLLFFCQITQVYTFKACRHLHPYSVLDIAHHDYRHSCSSCSHPYPSGCQPSNFQTCEVRPWIVHSRPLRAPRRT